MHGGGDGWNSSGMTHRLPDFQAGARIGLSATGAWRRPLPMMKEAYA